MNNFMSDTTYNILIALGSFKDVFTPSESCNIIKQSILKDSSFRIECCSLADGGEFSGEILSRELNLKKIDVKNVITPYKKKIISSYLVLDDNTVFICSSQILRILPKDDDYKNPMNLTSFGLGQLINDAINRGFSKILIGLGGTNTVDAGIGMAQALGAVFFDKNQKTLIPDDGKYFSGQDLLLIKKADFEKPALKLKNVLIESICDGRITIDDMQIPNNQKIGRKFNSSREKINDSLKIGILKYSDIIENYLARAPKKKFQDLIIRKQPFFGVAGGINLSLNAICNLNMRLGIDYFIEKLDIEKKIAFADLIITGEGRLDNSLGGKTPIGVSRLAKKHKKPVLYLTGDVNDSLKKYFRGDIAFNVSKSLSKNGVTAIISCHNFYTHKVLPDDILERNEIYRSNTPIIFERALREYFYKKRPQN